MDSSCGKYEKRLSACIDGQLPPGDMAELASHLEKCPSCSAMMEKMRRLEELAGGVWPAFDEALLARLSERIETEIEEIDKTGGLTTGDKTKIIPLWYRYAAVAASVIIVFFAGRMAFKETGTDIPRHRLPSFPQAITSPAALPPLPTAPEKDEAAPAAEKPPTESISPTAVVDEDADESKRISRKKVIADNGAAEPIDKEVQSQKALIQAPTIMSGDSEVYDRSQDHAEKDFITGKGRAAADLMVFEETPVIYGKITDRETGQPLMGAAIQLEGTTIGARTDFEGEFAIAAVPPDTYNLIYSAVGYQSKRIMAIPVRPDESIRVDAQIEVLPLNLDGVAEVEGGREGIDSRADKTFGKRLPIEATDESSPITIDSLETLYNAAIAGAAAPKPGFTMEAYKAVPVTAVDRYKALLDSVEASPKTAELYRRLETLYFKARASYDLYLETDDKIFLNMASEYKNALAEIINEHLEEDENNQILLNYKAEIERWRF